MSARTSSTAEAAADRRLHRALGWAVLLYLCFLVWGSLVPLDLQPMDWDQAWQRLLAAPSPDAPPLSRIDLAINLLLTVPLVLVLAARWHRPGRSSAQRLAVGLAVWAASAMLSLGVELAQAWVPARQPSLLDIAAQWVGAAAGLALHAWRGVALRRWARDFWQLQQGLPVARWLLRLWLVGLAAASLLPLDLSLSPVELYRKWHEGRVFLLPGADLSADFGTALAGLIIDTVLWLPVGLLWRLQGASIGRAALWGLLAAAVIELLQLTVISRVSSSTDVLVGAGGAALGAWAGGLWPMRQSAAVPTPNVAPAPATAAGPARWLVAALLAWALAMPLLYWFPYQAEWDPNWLRMRLDQAMGRMPFEALFASGEQRAMTEVLRKLLVFAPGGLLWAGWVVQTRRTRPRAWALAGLLAAVALAVAVELGQLALPGKVADATDAALGTVGALLGWIAGRRLWPAAEANPAPAPPSGSMPTPPQPNRPTRRPRRQVHAWVAIGRPAPWVGWSDLLTMVAVAASLWLATRLPGMPYNLLELMPASLAGGLAALALAAVLWWWLALPLVLAQRWQGQPGASVRLLPLLPCLGLPAGLLLLFGVPTESLHDVLGSPVLTMLPASVELLGRYAALHAGLSLAALGAAWGVARWVVGRPQGLLLMWLVALLAWAVPVHLVVVHWAATDNLTELMRGGGGPLASLCLGVGLTTLLSMASALAAALAGAPRPAALLVLALVAGPLGTGLLWLGSEPFVMKYGRVFSAAQFLLSGDRAHYAEPAQLLWRWGLALSALCALTVALQVSRWRSVLAPYSATLSKSIAASALAARP